MGLVESMSKITKFTSKLTSLSSNSLHANIPSNAFTSAMGIDGSYSFGSLGDIKASISNLKAGMGQTATLIYCSAIAMGLGEKGSFTDFWAGIGANLVSGAAGVIADIYQQVAEAVACQISMAVSQIVGAITSLVSALQNLVTSILILADGILGLAKNWLDWSNFKLLLEIEAEECKDFFSSIAACYLNKLLGPYIEEFTSKLVGAVNLAGNNLNQMLYDLFQDVNMLSSYVNQEAFLLQKASIQIKGLTKENLLGA